MALWCAAACFALALIFLTGRTAGPAAPSAFDRFASGVVFAPPTQLPPQQEPTVGYDPVQLSNSRPPPAAALASDPAAQAEFDSRAAPGEFVTPPSVSIAH